jgi:hypothetical protein
MAALALREVGVAEAGASVRKVQGVAVAGETERSHPPPRPRSPERRAAVPWLGGNGPRDKVREATRARDTHGSKGRATGIRTIYF